MKNALLYTIAGTGLSFALNYFLFPIESIELNLYNAFSFGLAWGMAHFLDREDFSLIKKLGISFIGICFLVLLGIFFFDVEKGLSTVMKYSVVFVAYYLLASLRGNKSLRK
ncbi:MAG: hypothetical protein KBA33_06410 [Cloacibacterium sp.]|nr:hypothetical protein [Cloacibacterium sp.]